MRINISDDQKKMLVGAVLTALLVVIFQAFVAFGIPIVVPPVPTPVPVEFSAQSLIQPPQVFKSVQAQNSIDDRGTLSVTGASTLMGAVSAGSTLDVTGATALNGGLTMDTNKFTVADTTGNTTIGGTLAVTGAQTNSAALTVNNNATITGTLNTTGAANFSASLKVGTLQKYNKQTTLEVTQGGTITPTGTYQVITSTAGITASTVATTGFVAGDEVVLINGNASDTIVLTNSGTLALPGAGDLTLGANDIVGLWYDGSKWFAVFASNN